MNKFPFKLQIGTQINIGKIEEPTTKSAAGAFPSQHFPQTFPRFENTMSRLFEFALLQLARKEKSW